MSSAGSCDGHGLKTLNRSPTPHSSLNQRGVRTARLKWTKAGKSVDCCFRATPWAHQGPQFTPGKRRKEPVRLFGPAGSPMVGQMHPLTGRFQHRLWRHRRRDFSAAGVPTRGQGHQTRLAGVYFFGRSSVGSLSYRRGNDVRAPTFRRDSGEWDEMFDRAGPNFCQWAGDGYDPGGFWFIEYEC